MQVEIHTDGSCLGNGTSNAPGGWACVLRVPGGIREKAISGAVPNTTNNRMEITAPLEGLKALKKPCDVHIYTDSQYVIGTMTKGWKRRKNNDLWDQLDQQVAKHTSVQWHWNRGHDGNPDNERCDSMAKAAATKLSLQLASKANHVNREVKHGNIHRALEICDNDD